MFDAQTQPVAANTAAVRLAESSPQFMQAAEAVAGRAVDRPLGELVSLKAGADTHEVDLTALPRPAEGLTLVIAHDRTLDANLREALIDSRQRFRELLDLAGVFGWECDAEGTLTFLSGQSVLGHPPKALLGRPVADTLARGLDAIGAIPFSSPMPVQAIELGLLQADGDRVPHQVSAVPIHDADGRWIGSRGVARDVGRERDRDRSLARALQRERLVARVLQSFRGEVEPQQIIAGATESIGKGMAAIGCQILAAIPSLAAVPPQIEILTTYGECGGRGPLDQVLARIDRDRPVEVTTEGWRVLAVPAWYRDQANGLMVIWRLEDEAAWDPDERALAAAFGGQVGIAIEQVHQHRRLIAVALTDPLTGLLNRRGFGDEMRRRFHRAQRSNGQAALMFVDLDNFKWVNDVHGHAAGDEVLVFVRDLLRNNSRPGDLIARMGGDEFVLWLDGCGREAAEKRARTMVSAAAALRRFSGKAAHPLGMSIGVVVYDPRRQESLNDLLSRADEMMYQVKRDGKGGFALSEREPEKT